MMKKQMVFGTLAVLFGLVGAALVSSCTGCGDVNVSFRQQKDTTVEVRGLSYFCKVNQQIACDVAFRQGDSLRAIIIGKPKDVKRVAVKVKDEELIIALDDEFSTFFKGSVSRVKVVVTSPDLTAVTLNGSGDFILNGALDTDNLKLSVYGSGEIEADSIVCDAFTAEVYGSGGVETKRVTTPRARLYVRGSGEIETKLVSAALTDIDVRGSGDVDVDFFGCDKARVGILGSGDVTAGGTLQRLSTDVKGTGDVDVKRLNVKQVEQKSSRHKN